MTIQNVNMISGSPVTIQGATDGSDSQVKNTTKTAGVYTTKDCQVMNGPDENVVYQKDNQEALKQTATELAQSEQSDEDYISKETTKEDLEQLAEEGTPLDQYTAEQLSRAIERIKSQRQAKQAFVEGEVEKRKEKMDGIEASAIANIVSALQAANLPVNEENIEQIVGAVDMTSSLFGMSEGTKRYLLQNQESITPEHIYQGAYSGADAEYTSQTGFEEIIDQAKQLIEQAGLEVNEETMNQASWIYENGIALTQEAITDYQYLQELENGLDETDVVGQIVDGVKDKLPAEKVPLLTISDKRKLEETRLQMTLSTDNAYDTEDMATATKQLMKYVDYLKDKEQEMYASYFEETDESKDASSVMLKQSLTVVRTIAQASDEVIGSTYGNKGMSNELSTVYEKVMTQVRPDLGDTVKQAFTHIDDMLKEMDLPVNQVNENTVKILAYNQMDINEDSINAMKQYEVKVNHLMEQMKPQVTAELIKKNQNPLTMTLDELSEAISGMKELTQQTSEESAAKFLWRMDKTDGLTQEERDSYVGIYRLLNQVEKSDGAAIGAVINSNRELTLGSLLSAVRSTKQYGMDYQIDDDFGATEDILFAENNIETQINSGFTYEQATVSTVLQQISPEKLKQMNDQSDLMDMPLDELAFELKDMDIEEPSKSAYFDYQQNQIKEAMNESAQVKDFLSEYQLEPTISFMSQASKHLKGNGIFADVDNESDYIQEIENVVDQFDDEEAREQAYTSLETKIQENSPGMMNQLSMFYGSLRKQERYEIPIMTGNEVTILNVTIDGDNRTGGSVGISFQNVNAQFTLKGKSVDGLVVSEDKETDEAMHMTVSHMMEQLESDGMEEGTIHYVTGHRVSGKTEHGQNNTVKQLYKIAKAFVQSMKTCEEANHED